MADRCRHYAPNVLQDEESGSSLFHYTNKLSEHRSALVANRSALTRSAEALAARTAHNCEGFADSQTGSFEELIGGHFPNGFVKHRQPWAVRFDGFDCRCVRLDRYTYRQACLVESTVKPHRPREQR